MWFLKMQATGTCNSWAVQLFINAVLLAICKKILTVVIPLYLLKVFVRTRDFNASTHQRIQKMTTRNKNKLTKDVTIINKDKKMIITAKPPYLNWGSLNFLITGKLTAAF